MATRIETTENDVVAETSVGVAATITSSAAVLSCAACCVLPLALPAAALAGLGTTLSWFEGASPWLRILSVLIVAAAWIMVWRQGRNTGRRAARSTLMLLSISTVLTVISLVWEPFIEAFIISLFH
ncbi:hypothetical protein [Sphingobium sp. DN12]|uniref:hypothetical protein n=1 Tax=Sphingobium sp. DN12 TaxID=3378073 RepID=UPI003DA305CB